MKIFAFVDTHGSSLDFKVKADVFVCAGDFTIFGMDQKKILRKMNKLGNVFLIHGNHESLFELKKDCEKFKNITLIHNNPLEFGDYVFIGWGGGGFSYTDSSFDKKDWSIYKNKKIVFITHAPPYNNCLDEVHGSNAGSKSFLKFVKKFKPELVICGHLHENEGKECLIGKTKCVNPGYQGKLIQIS